jgi:hypothetical protein
MTPEERFERIEAHLERSRIESDERFKRLETWLDNSIVRTEIDRQAHEVRIRKVEGLQVELLESQNAAFRAIESAERAIERLERLVENTIRGRGPNGHEGA